MLILLAIMTGFCVYRCILCLFVYFDAAALGSDAMSWLGLVGLLGLIGLVIWLVYRPRPARPYYPYGPYGPAGYYPPPPFYPPPAPPRGQIYHPGPAPPGSYLPAGAPAYRPPAGAPWQYPVPLHAQAGTSTAAGRPAGGPSPSTASYNPFAIHRMIATFIGAMAVTVFIELPLLFFIVAQGGASLTDTNGLMERLLSPEMLLLSVAVQDGILVLFVYIAMFRPGHLTLKGIGASLEARVPRGVAVGAFVGLALFGLANGIGYLLGATGWFGTGESIFQARTPFALALLLVATVAIAPPAEELFFRGYALSILERKWGPAAGIMLSAFMFALAHGSLYQLLPIFLVGVVLAQLFRKMGIVPCMVAHGVNNFLAIVILFLGWG